MDVGEVTAAATGDKDFLARAFGSLDHGNAPSSPARLERAHQSSRATTENQCVKLLRHQTECWIESERQTESHDRLSTRSDSFFEFLKQGGFQILRIGIHFARGNLLVGGALKTQLTNAQALLRAHRWSEDPTSHRASFIELTESSRRIERGARLMVRKLGKALFRLLAFIQQAAGRISGKILRKPGNRFPRALAHPVRTFRCMLLQIRKSLLETDGVELIYGKHSDAALRTPGTTRQPLAALARGVG